MSSGIWANIGSGNKLLYDGTKVQGSGLSWKSCRSGSEFRKISTLICKDICKKLLILTKRCLSRTEGLILVSNTGWPFPFNKFLHMHLKMLLEKWWAFCSGVNVLNSNICHISIFWTCVNSLWPSDVIWRQRSGSTLAQVMACCLTAPSHYLNQCWLIISEVQWHS